MRKIKSQSGAVELVWGKFYAASRLQHASRNMRHAKIKSGFTTEGTEFTEGELRSVAVLVLGGPLVGRTKPRITTPFVQQAESPLASIPLRQSKALEQQVPANPR
jgi:hypothetical protein